MSAGRIGVKKNKYQALPGGNVVILCSSLSLCGKDLQKKEGNHGNLACYARLEGPVASRACFTSFYFLARFEFFLRKKRKNLPCYARLKGPVASRACFTSFYFLARLEFFLRKKRKNLPSTPDWRGRGSGSAAPNGGFCRNPGKRDAQGSA